MGNNRDSHDFYGYGRWHGGRNKEWIREREENPALRRVRVAGGGGEFLNSTRDSKGS